MLTKHLKNAVGIIFDTLTLVIQMKTCESRDAGKNPYGCVLIVSLTREVAKMQDIDGIIKLIRTFINRSKHTSQDFVCFVCVCGTHRNRSKHTSQDFVCFVGVCGTHRKREKHKSQDFVCFVGVGGKKSI